MGAKIVDYKYKDGLLYTVTAKGTEREIRGGTTVRGRKYLMVRKDGRCRLVHRLIWEMFNGPIPDGFFIDHIDNNSLNNNIDNLRLVDASENQRNINNKLQKNNNTGFRWAYWNNSKKCYCSAIMIKGRSYKKCWFKNPMDAHVWAKKIHEEHE